VTVSVSGRRPAHIDESSYVVETAGLTKRFGDTTAVDAVNLRVPRGSAFGYLGPNGAGKTTLIRMLLGLIEPSAGSMRLLGRPLPGQRVQALARVGAIVDEPRFHPHLTGRQNLWALAAAREPAAHGRIETALQRVGLGKRAGDRVAKYSLGMRQRLGIAACLLADPELLILDEPMNGLDPAGMLEFRGLLREFVAEGRTVVLSSHLLDEVERTCDQIAIVDRGRVVMQGPIEELARGAAPSLSLSTSDLSRTRELLVADAAVVAVSPADDGLVVTLSSDEPARVAAAAIARRLVAANIDLYRLEIAQPTLEQRFLEMTSRLGVAA
jgi:ABC-2 type transport system ATP-binding protein